jgi:hypothetical protein
MVLQYNRKILSCSKIFYENGFYQNEQQLKRYTICKVVHCKKGQRIPAQGWFFLQCRANYQRKLKLEKETREKKKKINKKYCARKTIVKNTGAA